ncbi:uncharacterized protein L969DRAFT_127278 [Mixia osmundae IAM 14324]|uniref:Uncharacterized protein n=1 Tax=Mixia osmundae (strain CBS 9802 / IAM 14324 / JCM 22182 / KY 12970) TaxID=764103 RepID=G7DVA0_MIXOS|nr:uncharacterized protein L969DRAFT_127278 [Mixia osmundae IAM 14324]KEI42067.1 hypothetical protein L969DRAFT_127278 [Mixia osmundae IAM 14324]GAA94510.1 hypothetical protein E5Q_01162 [Mixia osmundae IAM 14324]
MSGRSVVASVKKLAQAWPKDRIRPQFQFCDAFVSAAERSFGSKETLSSAEQASAQRMVASLQRLQRNDAKNRYPVGPIITQPQSMPKHYVNLLQGLQRAESGEEPRFARLKRFFGMQI